MGEEEGHGGAKRWEGEGRQYWWVGVEVERGVVGEGEGYGGGKIWGRGRDYCWVGWA